MGELLRVSTFDHPGIGRDEIRPTIDHSRSSPLEWMRQRRVLREFRKAETTRQRTAKRMKSLGREWRIFDLKDAVENSDSTFLTIGPGGVFAVTVKDHGRSRISFAGDVVQVNGTRPKYVAEARKKAKHTAEALSRQAGVSIPVMPVLAFAGSGTISFYGMPKGCIVTSCEDLHRVLKARGRRLAAATVEKVFTLANNPRTWVNEPYVALADRYKWYPDSDRAGADKKPPQR